MKKQLIGLGTVLALSIPTITSFANEKFETPNNTNIETTQPKQVTASIKGTNVNLRKSPGTSSAVVAKLKNGQGVFCSSEPTVKKDGYTWQSVSTKSGLRGWVATKYLNYDGR